LAANAVVAARRAQAAVAKRQAAAAAYDVTVAQADPAAIGDSRRRGERRLFDKVREYKRHALLEAKEPNLHFICSTRTQVNLGPFRRGDEHRVGPCIDSAETHNFTNRN
jgi:hypothetical protein